MPTSAAPVWPPPPFSSPETLLVESVSVTSHGEQLILVNHKAVNRSPYSLLPPLIIYAALWLNSLRTWVSIHHVSGPLNVVWNNPAFRQEAIVNALIFGVMAVGLTGFSWHRNAGDGQAVIHRSTKTMEAGRRSGVIRSVAISRVQPFFLRRYFVFPLLRTGRSKSSAGLGMQTMYAFRRKENAERVARKLADFLDVPLRDFSGRQE